MAVLVEAISVIVRCDAINAWFQGGWSEFIDYVPNSTLCTDEDIARVGFMSPADVEAFVEFLERGGLTDIRNGEFIDIAVVDQMSGPTLPVKWLKFAHLPFGSEGNKIAVCWLFEGSRDFRVGLYTHGNEMNVVVPDGWNFEESLSANCKFIKNENMKEELKFLRHEDGKDVYLDLATEKEIYVGRPQINKGKLYGVSL